MKKLLSIAALSLLALSSLLTVPAQAAGTATGSFDVTINLTSACRISTAPGTLTLAYTSLGAAPTPVTTGFAVECTNTLPYTMSIGAANATMAGVNLTYDLVVRNAGDTADILPAASQTAGASPTSYLIKASMAGGQQGTCATATCSATATRTLTITY